ncbi:GNAT family N-acetyltransferase [Jannaschia marina]|uniref:GNAT family N-acetyltransferase n=1 Tax=Jannaschia marina TaxID=2741674 RepID=UPI0015CB0D61|nr:GNAT family N-acetyltransferase [Jannaschia marina]
MPIRPARTGDAAACVAILAEWIEATPWMPRLHSDDAMLTFWRGRLAACPGWVAEDGEGIAGFCLRDETVVTALYVRAMARGRGHGRMLLAAAMAGQERVTLWTFRANMPARTFYATAGFREIARSEGDNEEGLSDVRLAWDADEKRT